MKLNQKDLRSSCSGRESVESDIIEPKDKGAGQTTQLEKYLHCNYENWNHLYK